MKKSGNDVFLFTLVDFLLQLLFFGLLLYVVLQAAHTKELAAEKHNSMSFLKLQEWVNTMGGQDAIRASLSAFKFVQELGGEDELRAVRGMVEEAGGVQRLEAKLARLAKLEQGSGKPPCLTVNGDGQKTEILANVVASDERVRFVRSNPDLEQVLSLLGTHYAAVQDLSLDGFKAAFRPLTRIKPECRYTLGFAEKTLLAAPRKAVEQSFYLDMVRAP